MNNEYHEDQLPDPVCSTDAEIDAVIKEMPAIIARLRQMSPFEREFLK